MESEQLRAGLWRGLSDTGLKTGVDFQLLQTQSLQP